MGAKEFIKMSFGTPAKSTPYHRMKSKGEKPIEKCTFDTICVSTEFSWNGL